MDTKRTRPEPDASVAAGEPEQPFDTGHLSAGLGQRAARGAALTMGSNGVRFLLETARIIVLARLLLPADYGLVAMVTAVTGMIEMFKDLGLNMATVTRATLSHAQVSTLFWVNVGVGIGLMALTAATAPLLSWFYGEVRLAPIAFAIAPSFLLAGLAVQHQALLRRQMRFGTLASIQILDVSVGLGAAFFVAYQGGGYWALVAMTIASAFANAVAVWVASGWRPGRPVRGVGTREMVRFGGQVTGTNLVGYLGRRLDQLLLGWWWGAIPLGLYTKSNSLVEAPLNRAFVPIGSVVVPSLSRLAGEPTRYRDAYLRVLEKLCLVSMPGAAFMAGCAQWLIPALLGPNWSEASPIFAVLALLGFLRPIEGSSWWLFVPQDRADDALRWSFAAAGISAVAIVVGLPRGAQGVATALVVVSFVRLPLLVWYTTRKGPVRACDVYRTLATPAAAAACALGVLIGLRPWVEGLAPALAAAIGLVITGAVALGVLCSLPSGRRALLDIWSSLEFLRRRRTSGSAQG